MAIVDVPRRHARNRNWIAAGALIAAGISTAVVMKAAPRQALLHNDVRVPGLDAVLKAGWRFLDYHGCRIEVPDTWMSTRDAALIFGPDGSTVSTAILRFDSWPAHAREVRSAFAPPTIVRETTDRRLWLETRRAHTIEHYVDVSTPTGSCVAVIAIPREAPLSADDLQTLIDGVGAAPDHWPPR
jgi:hypothetical protein